LRRNPQRTLQRTIAALASGGISPHHLATSEPGHAESLAREAIAQGADLILVLGGDGTVNEVVQGLVHSNVPLGVLPGGTANVLAMELGLGSRSAPGARKLAAFEPRPVALGRISGSFGSRYFLLMAGAGLDANIVYEVSAGLKHAAGKLAYWAAGFARFFKTVEAARSVGGPPGSPLRDSRWSAGSGITAATWKSPPARRSTMTISKWFYSKDRTRCVTLGTC
jgi:diacylglycerol kinase family enzyme